jgi:hypothetical protein
MENIGSTGWKVFNTLASAAGIAMSATALGVKANASHFNRNGCNGEYWGSYNNCGCNHGYGYGYNGIPVNRFEMEQNLAIANLVAKDYSNQSDLKLFADYTARDKEETQRVNNRFETIFQELVASRERMQAEICKLDKEAALNKQAMEYNLYISNSNIDKLAGRVNNITKEVVPIDAICPEPLAACTRITANPQILTTTAATTTGTVVSGTVDVK